MKIYLAGGGTRPYVIMDLFLAGGISGNISAAWKRLAHDIEQCKFTLQERTEKPESCAKFLGGVLWIYTLQESIQWRMEAAQ